MSTTGISPIVSQIQASDRPQAAVPSHESEVAKEFEALFLGQFVEQVMSTVELKTSGGGQGEEMWRSFLSQAIAEQLTEQGGLGLKSSVEQMLAAYKS